MSTALEKRSLEKVMKNLNKEIQKIGTQTMTGLIEAAALIRRDMDKTPPLIPVDTGNLRSSWETIPVWHKRKPVVIMGFNANYATHVHNMYGAHFQRPGAGAGFFVASVNRNKKNVVEIIRKRAYVGR